MLWTLTLDADENESAVAKKLADGSVQMADAPSGEPGFANDVVNGVFAESNTVKKPVPVDWLYPIWKFCGRSPVRQCGIKEFPSHA